MFISAPRVTISGRFLKNYLCSIKISKGWQLLSSFLNCLHFRRHVQLYEWGLRGQMHSQENLLFNSSIWEQPSPPAPAHWAQGQAQLLSSSTTCAEHAMKYREVLVEPPTPISTAVLQHSWVPVHQGYLILKCCTSAFRSWDILGDVAVLYMAPSAVGNGTFPIPEPTALLEKFL